MKPNLVKFQEIQEFFHKTYQEVEESCLYGDLPRRCSQCALVGGQMKFLGGRAVSFPVTNLLRSGASVVNEQGKLCRGANTNAKGAEPPAPPRIHPLSVIFCT